MPAPPKPTLTSEQRPSGLLVIHIEGELDTRSTREIEPEFARALLHRARVALVDLRGVPFLTSAALALIVVHAQALQRGGGALYLAGATDLVREVFDRAGFSLLFPIFPTLEEGIREVEQELARRKQDPPAASKGTG